MRPQYRMTNSSAIIIIILINLLLNLISPLKIEDNIIM